MNSLNEALIEKLTWALTEVTTPNGKPSLNSVADVLRMALEQAILTKEAANRLQSSFIRTAQVLGQ